MKTEFNVERVCERVQMCVVDAPEELGAALIEVKDGCLHISFPGAVGSYAEFTPHTDPVAEFTANIDPVPSVLVNSIEVRPGPGHPDFAGFDTLGPLVKPAGKRPGKPK